MTSPAGRWPNADGLYLDDSGLTLRWEELPEADRLRANRFINALASTANERRVQDALDDGEMFVAEGLMQVQR